MKQQRKLSVETCTLYSLFYECSCREWYLRNSQHHPFATSAAGGLATIVADGMMAPFDVVKQRMQLKSSAYSNVFHCISTVYRQHGIGAFFIGKLKDVLVLYPFCLVLIMRQGYKTTLIMNVPFTAIHFTVYESCKKIIHKWRNIAADDLSVTSQLLSGAMAGACASALTNPFDVVRTRLQTQGEVSIVLQFLKIET
jgi:solute carrier family 25 iron transporter 28/37